MKNGRLQYRKQLLLLIALSFSFPCYGVMTIAPTISAGAGWWGQEVNNSDYDSSLKGPLYAGYIGGKVLFDYKDYHVGLEFLRGELYLDYSESTKDHIDDNIHRQRGDHHLSGIVFGYTKKDVIASIGIYPLNKLKFKQNIDRTDSAPIFKGYALGAGAQYKWLKYLTVGGDITYHHFNKEEFSGKTIDLPGTHNNITYKRMQMLTITLSANFPVKIF